MACGPNGGYVSASDAHLCFFPAFWVSLREHTRPCDVGLPTSAQPACLTGFRRADAAETHQKSCSASRLGL